MKTRSFSIILCASPTCRACVTVSLAFNREQMEALAVERGWAIEQQAGDSEPQPYCERCKDGTR